MRGFVTIDRKRGQNTVAVWTTSWTERAPNHVNAVVTNLDDDPNALWTVRTLTRDAAVFLTEGSDPMDLPLDAEPHSLSEIDRLLDATVELQRRIIAAIDAYAIRPLPETGKPPKTPRKLVYPAFTVTPSATNFNATDESPEQRALAAANYLRAAWRFWAEAEEQRRQRTKSPKGKTPWMMPAGLDSVESKELPDEFLVPLRVESLSVSPWTKVPTFELDATERDQTQVH